MCAKIAKKHETVEELEKIIGKTFGGNKIITYLCN